MSDLKFSNKNEALQYLADITDKKIKIASLDKMFIDCLWEDITEEIDISLDIFADDISYDSHDVTEGPNVVGKNPFISGINFTKLKFNCKNNTFDILKLIRDMPNQCKAPEIENIIRKSSYYLNDDFLNEIKPILRKGYKYDELDVEVKSTNIKELEGEVVTVDVLFTASLELNIITVICTPIELEETVIKRIEDLKFE